MSAKENIPVIESLSSLRTRVEKFKTATGTQSNSNSGVSSVSSRRVDCVSDVSNAGTNDRRTLTGRRKYNGEDRNVEILTPDNKSEEKVIEKVFDLIVRYRVFRPFLRIRSLILIYI